MSRMSLGGKIVQVVTNKTATSGSTTSTIPQDNTKPQNTEGASCGLDTAITPTDSNNKLVIFFQGAIDTDAGIGLVALFKDSDADALKAVIANDYSTGAQAVNFIYEMTAGSTSEITFKLRYGANSGTSYWLRESAGDRFNGVLTGEVVIFEVKP